MSRTSIVPRLRTGRPVRLGLRFVAGVLLTLAASLAPAGSPTATALTKTATTLTGVLSSTSVPYDATVTLDGSLTDQPTGSGQAGQTVALYGRVPGAATWDHLTDTVTSGTGTYSFSLPNQTRIYQYQARYGGDATYASSVSAQRKLTVHAPLTDTALNPPETDGIVGDGRTWSGSTAASLSGTNVAVERLASGTWQVENYGSVAADGTFSVDFALNYTGAYSYRLDVLGSAELAATTGTAVVLTAGTLAVSPTPLPVARQYKTYSFQLTATHGEAPLTWSVDEAMPEGLTFSDTGLVSGTPTQIADTPLTIHVSDARGQFASRSVTLRVQAPTFPLFLDPRVPSGQVGVGYAYHLRIAGGTQPVTVQLTGGSLPPGVTFDAAHRLVTGTPTGAASTMATFTATDAAAHATTVSLAMHVTSASNWDQAQRDDARTSYNPGEETVGADDVSSVGSEWSMPATTADAVHNGVEYSAGVLPGTVSTSGITARDLATGRVLWSVDTSGPDGSNASCTRLSLGVTSVVCDTGNEIKAYSMTGTHPQLWSTADTDAGSTFSDSLVSGSYVLTARTDGGAWVAAYNLGNGQLRWKRAAAAPVQGMVVAAGNVFVVDAAGNVKSWAVSATGTAGWQLHTTNIQALVAIPGALLATEYVAGDTSVSWRSLTDGSVTKTFISPRPIYGVLAADDHNAYLPTAAFDEFGGVTDAGVTAVDLSSGLEQWHVDTADPIRAGMAVAGSVLWVHASDLARNRQPSTMLAVDTASGAVLRTITADDTSASPPIAANGRLVVPLAFVTQVWGVSPEVPTISTAVLPVAWKTMAYNAQLAATGGSAPYTWALTSGTLPAGLTLSGDGSITGTPSATGTSRFSVTASDGAGRSVQRQLSIATRLSAVSTWVTGGGASARTGLAKGEASLTSDSVGTLIRRWSTPALPDGANVMGQYGQEVVASGARLFCINTDGAVCAYSTTNGLNHVPLWTTPAPTAGQIFEGTPTLVGSPTTGTIYAVTSDGLLVALSAATGVVAWSTQLPDVSSWGPTAAGPLAVGGRIVVQAGPEVTAVDTATHTVSWSHPLAAADPNQPTDASTDGSLVFVFDGCDVVAVHGSDGTEAWRSRVPRTVPLSCSGPFSYSFGGEIAPVVSNGVVYATEYYHGVAAFNAHTGTVRWRQNLHASITAASATEQWLVLTSHEDGILVLDNQTGALVGQTGADLPPVQSGVTVAGDLLFYNDTNQRIAAVDLTTMQQVWTSSVLAPYGFVQNRPTIAKGRIYTYTGDNRIVGIAQ